MLPIDAGHRGVLQLMVEDVRLKFREELSRYVRRRVSDPDDAEDLVQDIVLKLVDKSGPVEADRLLYWVFAVARNRVTDYYRAAGRKPDAISIDEQHLSAEQTPDRERITTALGGVLPELITRLSERDQHALTTVDLEGMSQKDYAKQLGIDYTSAKSRVQRARKRLRNVLEQCCDLEFDRRGAPLACEPRRGGECC